MTGPAGTVPGSRIDAELIRALGGSPRSRGRWRAFGAWLASVGVHGVLAVLVLLFAATASRLVKPPPPPPALVMDFQSPVYAPTAALARAAEAAGDPRPSAEVPSASETQREALRKAADEALAAIRASASPLSLAAHRVGRLGGESRPIQVDFIGLRASNARRIVYVVDASGSLVGSFPQIVEELRRSLMKLDPRQQFGVIFFQRGEAVTVPPGGSLQPATPEALAEAVKWIDSRMIPTGRSNPLAAMEAAMQLKPEIVFLLSADITGAGEYEISERQLLDDLDRLNPKDADTGIRPVRIQCVQFLDPDPAGTLERLATEHGGADGYRYLGRAELGLDRN